MAQDSRIEWTDHTFNPWWGCTKVSSACDHCYAERWARRLGRDIWGYGAPRWFLSESYWRQPLKWDALAARQNHRARVFCASMADVFEWKKDLSFWRERLWHLIEETPNLDWLLLTKRPHLVNRLTPWGEAWPRNVWVGTTVETQRSLDKRVPYLEGIPCNVRFLSCEPLLGPLNLDEVLDGQAIHWIIAGGESGAGSRPCDPAWLCAIRDACLRTETPFHFKQWGDWAPLKAVDNAIPQSIIDSEKFSAILGRFGKKTAGRELENRIWDEFPTP